MALYDLDFGEIVSTMRQRISQDGELLRKMVEIRDRYNGDIVIPLPDVEGQKPIEPPTPRLIQDAIDHTAMRANSLMPRIDCPPVNSAQVNSQKRALDRRRFLYGSWYHSQLDLKLYRAYRHYTGYGTFSFLVMPDDHDQHATVNLRDPLTTYPELRAPDDIRDPLNVGYVFGRSSAWIRKHYPQAWETVISPSAAAEWDTLWDMVEWIDGERVVMGIMGPRMPAYSPQESKPYGYSGYEITRWPNKAGLVPAVVPRRLTLDKVLGQVMSLISTTDLFARLTALDVIATEKAIFPDVAVIGKGNAPPQLISGAWKDGRTGDVNLLTESAVQVLQSAPGPLTAPLLDRLEDSIRDSGGIPDLYGGANGGMRTGRGVDALGAFSVDPRIQEAQAVMARALGVLNTAYLEVTKAYYPDKKFTYFPGLPGVDEPVEVVPSKDFDSTLNVVSYPFSGSDISQVSVALAQLSGAGLISKKTARRKHPMIDDEEQEESDLALETLASAVTNGLAQQLVSGQFDIDQAVQILDRIKRGDDLVEAYQRVKDEAAKAQAAQQSAAPGVEPGGPSSPPGAPPGGANPQALSGMLQAMGQQSPGGGPGPTLPEPPPSLVNVRHLTQALNADISPGAV